MEQCAIASDTIGSGVESRVEVKKNRKLEAHGRVLVWRSVND